MFLLRGADVSDVVWQSGEMCERCEHGDHENCVGEPTELEGGYTTCCCNAHDTENVICDEDEEVVEVEMVA